jgi:hypothetical protein
MQKDWLDSYFLIQFANKSKRHDLNARDIRAFGLGVFGAIKVFCDVIKSTVTDAEEVFVKEDFISNQALSSKCCGVHTTYIYWANTSDNNAFFFRD